MGDWIQLSRLLPVAKAQSQATILLWMPKGLGPLLSGLADRSVDAPPAPDTFDAQLPLDLLPVVCPLTSEVLGSGPYLQATADALARWQRVFADRHVIHIGLHWTAEATHLTGKHRSIALSALAPLLRVGGTRFYSLQPGAETEIEAYPQVVDLGRADNPGARFLETAGIIAQLDLVIAVDSAIGHLAGALGTPCWLMLGFAHDPQWGRRAETPFYPTHRLFRSADPRDVSEVSAVVADELDYRIGQGDRAFV